MIKFLRTILLSYVVLIPSLHDFGVIRGTKEDIIISMLVGIALLIFYGPKGD